MKIPWLHHVLGTACVALVLATGFSPAMAENKSDIWWNPADPGRGLIVIDHETDLFVVWCTYDPDGWPTWVVVPGGTLSADRRYFQGDLYSTLMVDDDRVQATRLGTASIDFAPGDLPPGAARFSLHVGPTTEMHVLARQPFGSAPTDWGNDATDMWWDPRAPGIGVAAIQHGSHIFAIELTYDYMGMPAFWVVPSQSAAAHPGETQFDGTLYRTRISTYGEAVLDVEDWGPATLTFAAAQTSSAARMVTVMGSTQSWQQDLVRLPFGVDALSPTPAAGSMGSR